jgi:hypothetical protein
VHGAFATVAHLFQLLRQNGYIAGLFCDCDSRFASCLQMGTDIAADEDAEEEEDLEDNDNDLDDED